MSIFDLYTQKSLLETLKIHKTKQNKPPKHWNDLKFDVKLVNSFSVVALKTDRVKSDDALTPWHLNVKATFSVSSPLETDEQNKQKQHKVCVDWEGSVPGIRAQSEHIRHSRRETTERHYVSRALYLPVARSSSLV